MKTLLRERVQKGYPDEPLLAATQTKGVVRKEKYENRTVLALKDLHLLKLVLVGDFVISLRSFQGGIEYARERGIISPAYTVLFPVFPGMHAFLAWLFKSSPFLENLSLYVTGIRQGQNIDYEKLGRAGLPVPSFPEQVAIVRFLNYMDLRIQRYIRAKQKLIKLLEEQKQAIIHHIVTRGLHPYVRLKPSGVKWLGDVPEHWRLVPLRRLVPFVTSGSRGWANFYSETGDIFLQSGNLGRSMSLNLSFIQHVQPPQGSEGERTRVQRDDILVCITGALTGNVAHVNMDLPATAFVNQHVALARPNQAIVYPRYLAFALHSEIGRIQFKAGEYGGTKQGLSLDDVKSTLVLLPPMSEQIAICSELDTKITGLAMAVSRTEHEIFLLREYRTRLIADVVTGKLDVREAAARLPDETEEPEPLDEADVMSNAEEDAVDDLDAPPEEDEP